MTPAGVTVTELVVADVDHTYESAPDAVNVNGEPLHTVGDDAAIETVGDDAPV